MGLIVGCSPSSGNQSGDSISTDQPTQSLPTDCRTISHDAGETEVCGQPETVVALSVHVLDLLLSLGMQPAGLATVGNFNQGSVFDNPAQQIPYLGDRLTTQPVNLGNAAEPSLEALTALKPDLIIGEAGRNADTYDVLSQIAPTILWSNRTDKGQWRESLEVVAIAIDQEEKVRAAIQKVEALIADTRAELADVVEQYPTVLLLGASRLNEGIYAIEPESYLGELLEGVGFQMISLPSLDSRPGAPISIEALPEFNDMDTIILLGYNADFGADSLITSPDDETTISEVVERHQVKTIREDWEENAIAQTLPASKNNRVYFATYYKWNGLNGPIGAELVLEQLREFFLDN
ncbi:MAG: iron-siderophore ABC transporter substrate-binding protein [Cyanobacteria bacterium P01_E01_bin.6]